jgi:hypothetical protein
MHDSRTGRCLILTGKPEISHGDARRPIPLAQLQGELSVSVDLNPRLSAGSQASERPAARSRKNGELPVETLEFLAEDVLEIAGAASINKVEILIATEVSSQSGTIRPEPVVFPPPEDSGTALACLDQREHLLPEPPFALEHRPLQPILAPRDGPDVVQRARFDPSRADSRRPHPRQMIDDDFSQRCTASTSGQ